MKEQMYTLAEIFQHIEKMEKAEKAILEAEKKVKGELKKKLSFEDQLVADGTHEWVNITPKDPFIIPFVKNTIDHKKLEDAHAEVKLQNRLKRLQERLDSIDDILKDVSNIITLNTGDINRLLNRLDKIEAKIINWIK